MNWQEFEEHMKAGIPSHESEVDTEHLWNAIREKKRRRRPLWWWFAGAGLLLAFVGWWNYPSGQTAASTNETSGFLTNAVASPNAPEKLSMAAPVSAGVEAQNPLETPSFVAPTTPISFAQQASFARRPNQRSATNNPTLSSKNTGTGVTPNSSVPSSGSERSGVVSPTVPAPGAHSGAPFTTPKTAGTAPLVPNLHNPDARTFGPITDLQNRSNAVPAPVLPPAPLRLLPVISAPLPRLLPVPVRPLPAPPPRPVPPAKEIWAGVETATGGWYIRQRVDSLTLPHTGEARLEFVDIGVRLRLPVYRRWHLTTGVGYARYNSVFRWKQTWWRADSTSVPISYTDGTRDSIKLIRSVRYQRNVAHYNRVTALRIPVEVHYAFPWRTCTIAPFAGVQVDVLQRASGRMEAPNGALTNDYAKEYQRRMVVGVRGGVTGMIPLWSGWYGTVSPFFAADYRPRSTNGRERFAQWGIGLGVWKNLR